MSTLSDQPADLAPAPPPRLEPHDFARLAGFVERNYGIHLPPAKKTLLESRLGKRVRDLGLSGFGAYCDRVLSGADPDELVRLIDRVTTHKTDFFREPRHFELLDRQVVPAALRAGAPAGELQVWSAACSTGEEPYSAAMVLAEAAQRDPRLRFRIVATDVSAGVLQHARHATYTEDQVQPIPLELRRKYLLRSVSDPTIVKVRKALRDTVHFRQLNLLDRDYGMRESMGVVFLRNVLIYFTRSLQEQVLGRIAGAMVAGGFLFLGHSESLNGFDLPFEQAAPTVYRRRPGVRDGGRT